MTPGAMICGKAGLITSSTAERIRCLIHTVLGVKTYASVLKRFLFLIRAKFKGSQRIYVVFLEVPVLTKDVEPLLNYH